VLQSFEIDADLPCAAYCVRLVYLSCQECYNTPPLQKFTANCYSLLTRARWHPYRLQLLNDCKYV